MSLDRPHVVLSAATSIDGYIDDASPRRLILSSPREMEAVRRLRGEHDAILVGANTVRRDNPGLGADGPRQPVKVTVTASGDLDPKARFFVEGDVDKIVYCATPQARRRLQDVAHAVEADGWPAIFADLAARGVGSVLVEGGGTVHTQLLLQGLADELRLAVAPLFVGDPAAPRFVGPGAFPHDSRARMRLRRVESLGDVAVLHYTLGGDNG
ncbi:MAG: RibD family protein [Stackebrandtia sp.]